MQALTHKLWAKDYLNSTYRVELTNIVEHAMCGVTNELLKPGADPRKVVKLAENLRAVALTRLQEGRVKEAQLALKQAKAMTESCIAAIKSGADLRRIVGVQELGLALATPKSVRAAPQPDHEMGAQNRHNVEHKANELLIRITCDLVDLTSKAAAVTVAQDASHTSRQMTFVGTARSGTDRRGALSAPPAPIITIHLEEWPGASSLRKELPWAAASGVGTTSLNQIANARERSNRPRTESDFLCGQIASSPIAGFPV